MGGSFFLSSRIEQHGFCLGQPVACLVHVSGSSNRGQSVSLIRTFRVSGGYLADYMHELAIVLPYTQAVSVLSSMNSCVSACCEYSFKARRCRMYYV